MLWIKFHDRLVTVKYPYIPEHIHYWVQYNSGCSMKSWICFTESHINALAGLCQIVLWFQLSRGSMEPIWFVEGAERLSGSGSSVGWQPQRRSCRRWRHAPCCLAVPTAQTKSQKACEHHCLDLAGRAMFVTVASAMIWCLVGPSGHAVTWVQVRCFGSIGKNGSLVCVLIVGYFFLDADSEVLLFFSTVCSREGCRWLAGEHMTLLTVLSGNYLCIVF
jgi:hypothetical protein